MPHVGKAVAEKQHLKGQLERRVKKVIEREVERAEQGELKRERLKEKDVEIDLFVIPLEDLADRPLLISPATDLSDQRGFAGDGGGLQPVDHVQRAEDRRDMCLHRLLGQVQLAADLLVGEAAA